MNVLIVDTSSWISFLRGSNLPSLELGLKEGRAYLSPIVLAELLSSFHPESKKQDFIKFLKELPLCDTPFEHWTRTGELRATLSKKGISVSTPDAHIAQCALDLDCYLLSENKVFRNFPAAVGLRVLTQ